jgi:Ser/Thr protein kinase RdoA (MazF antagonist)
MEMRETLTGWLETHYALGPQPDCHLLRSHTNDVYVVTSTQGRYVLKVYGVGWRTEEEVRYELAFLRHLAAQGMRIAGPIPRCDGDWVGVLETPEGARCVALFEYAPGSKPESPFSPTLYHAFGHAIGTMHTLSDSFVAEQKRRPLDLRYLLEEPLALALPLIEASEDRSYLAGLGERVSREIAARAKEGLDWGPVHGDASLDNLHVTADGSVVLYDFDSGGTGWRALDLQGWAKNQPEFKEKWQAFRSGYAEAHPLQQNDLEAAPYLTLATDIWGLQVELTRRVLPQGPEAVHAYLSGRIAWLREREKVLMPFSDVGFQPASVLGTRPLWRL